MGQWIYLNRQTAAGACMASAWIVFGDAIIAHEVRDIQPSVTSAHWIPGALAMWAFILLLASPIKCLASEKRAMTANCWIFWTFAAFFLSMGVAAFLTNDMRATSRSAYSYVSGGSEWDHVYVGIASLAQVILIFMSGGLWFSVIMDRFQSVFD